MLALTNDIAIGAAERGMRRFCDLLATADRPDAPAIGSWRVRDVGAHLTGISAYTAMLRGTPSPAASIDEVTDWNAGNVAAAADDDVAAIADRVADGFGEFVGEVSHHPADEIVGWHAGLPMPVSTLCTLVAGEAYIHGWDIARALRRPWRMEPDDMRTIFRGLLPVLPHYVDPGISPSFSATFDVRLRGGPDARAAFVFDHGVLDFRPAGTQRADCRISADPAAFILITYGRTGTLAPAVRGRVVATGRKPWLGLSLPAPLPAAVTQTPDSIDDPVGRFRLRGWRPDDIEPLTAIWQDAALTDRFPVDVPFTTESARAFVALATESWHRGEAYHLAIVAGDEPDTILGGCDLSGLGGPDPPDVGYWLAPATRGQGLATLVVSALVAWAEIQLDVSELVLEVEPDNAPSIAVAERAGFRSDGTQRQDDVRGRRRTLDRYHRYRRGRR